MAALIFLLLLSLSFLAAAQQRNSNITLGSSLKPTGKSSWLSTSGLYAFGFYQQGHAYAVGIFLAGIPQRTVVWTANRDRPTVPINAVLNLTRDGQLVLRETQGQDDRNIVDPYEPAAFALMLDSGNFVLYNSNGRIVWQSFDNPTNTLLSGQRLSTRQELFSSISETDHSLGIFRLKMQEDGNLVQYPVQTPDTATNSYWSSGTSQLGNNVSLNLDDDGHLYLFQSNVTVKNLTGGGYPVQGKIYLMRLDVDGIFRLYSYNLDRYGNWSIIFRSSADECDPKGLCGLNAYCTHVDGDINCLCLPGYDFVNPGNWSAGCERYFPFGSCNNKDKSVDYKMIELQSITWEDVSYSVASTNTKEECETTCLKDCDCEAALFKDRSCAKQRLPLRYGKRLSSDSNILLIKVGTPASVVNSPPTNLQITQARQRMDILIVGISLVGLASVAIVISGILLYRKHRWAYGKISGGRDVELCCEDIAPRAFTYAELEQVTDNFKEELGRGASGTVYKGIISGNQKAVAVKRLEHVSTEGEREFKTEIKVIAKTYHRNLVRLVGYCIDGTKRLLVYEYMKNGSLADILFSPEKQQQNWNARIGMALDIAKGVLYLHEECETQIIHCDIKPQNILMDEHGCMKIADFGLAKLLKADQTKTYTGIRGTKGYVAPEWHRNLPVSVKADVYSFGIVLLEIICCRRNVDWSLSEDEAVLEEWAYNCFEVGELNKLVRDENIDMRKFLRFVKIGLWCIQEDPSLRPSMKKVVLMLEGTVEIPLPPSPTSFLSTI